VRESIGPFELASYLRPVLFFGVPSLVAIAGVSFAIGTLVRRPILVFFLPVALLLVCAFFLWSWNPTWLSSGWDRVLMLCDPSGYRWLKRTWIDVDRGVDFYNTSRVGFDAGFLASRAAWIAFGLGAVVITQWRFSLSLRGHVAHAAGTRAGQPAQAARSGATPTDIRGLGMTAVPRGWFASALEAARIEWHELRSSPGLYLFVPLIVLQIAGSSVYAIGMFDTPILPTSGLVASRSVGLIATLVVLLLLFYSVESLERERASGLDGIHRSTPLSPSALLFGKALANSVVAAAVLVAAFLACAAVILVKGRTSVDAWPFVACWGPLLATFVLWTSFVMCVQALTRNRYASYAIGLATLALFGWLVVRGELNWAGNWMLWGTTLWSDFGSFDISGRALLMNRAFALAMAGLFLALAIRFQGRRDSDGAALLARLRPTLLWKANRGLLAYAVVPLALGIWLDAYVDAGFQGDAYEKQQKDYWRANVQTWKDAPKASIARAEVDVRLLPAEHALESKGEFELENREEKPLESLAFTTGPHWRDTRWTIDGAPVEREGKTLLHVLPLPKPLAPGERVRVGFAFHGALPEGPTKNGGGSMEFVLPPGAVLTSFSPSFVPVVGFLDGVGVDKDNRSDPREYPSDHWKGPTPSGFGIDAPYPTRITVRGPVDWRLNSIGLLVSDDIVELTLEDLARDPLGSAPTRDADGTARRRYSEWFLPFPWQELKLSEFPGLSGYAMGFATNIPFSESIGFLTESTPETEAAWLVVAHEAAHQWWGNLLSPGKGPGGNILSEGMSHFSTLLLFESEKGLRGRIAFAKRIEERYGERRRVDSERPLVRIDGAKDGDETVTYDKGGWAFWMLLNHLGRERGMQGYREFLARFTTNRDHPVLEDFLLVMREFAADPAAFDAFARQWFHEVVVPEYEILDAVRGAPVVADTGRQMWTTRLRVRNKGTGRMPLQIAVTRGERFPKEPEPVDEPATEAQPAPQLPDSGVVLAAAQRGPQETADAAQPAARAHAKPSEPYRESRALIELGAGEEQELVLTSEFEPQQVIVDPDALVLQLNRKHATKKLD
jgi:ABC-type transport system involved in multi-copper enzyme maturation permease subunit